MGLSYGGAYCSPTASTSFWMSPISMGIAYAFSCTTCFSTENLLLPGRVAPDVEEI